MGEFLDFVGICFGFSLLCISATQSLAFPSPRDTKVYDTSRWRHISCVRPADKFYGRCEGLPVDGRGLFEH